METKRSGEAIAHVRLKPDGTWDEPHDLLQHLRAVAESAGSMASTFGSFDWAWLAGLWHDLGKYKPEFQDYIRNASGYERDVASEGGGGRVDHSIVGAIHAQETFGPGGKSRVLGYLIAGHHAGLSDWNHDPKTGGALKERLKDLQHLLDALTGNPPSNILLQPEPSSLFPGTDPKHQLHFWIRFLFSCLVDADFLDTEKYMSVEKTHTRQQALPELAELETKLAIYLSELTEKSREIKSGVNILRAEILQQCLDHAGWEPGLFSLTVPTGGGKTLSGMAFALKHALLHQKRRVIVAIPYTSIIEQTAKQYRDVFGEDAVLEHHSNLDPERESAQSRLASENWDAPIIVTTNVQLFESLFASRTSACRKLHNIVNSVIILDEAQMFPPVFLDPILSSIKTLVEVFGCSVVLSTATQPALIGRFQSGRSVLNGFERDSVRELMDAPADLARRLHRVEIQAFSAMNEPAAWPEIAQALSIESQVLCIVNTRKDCRELFDLMPVGTIHLSALMCAEHRSDVIKKIKAELRDGHPVRVVSTQLVEAGVDLDFPVVYRAMAGFDSIAQAAGRCNREGRLNDLGLLGKTVIFKPPKDAPSGLLRKGQDAGEEILRLYPDLAARLSPEIFEKYFQTFFGSVNSFDEKGILQLLAGPDSPNLQFQFRTAAGRFNLIDDKGQVPVFVLYDERIRDLIAQVEDRGPCREVMRRLQRYSVTVPERTVRELADQGYLREVKNCEGRYTQTDLIVDGKRLNIYDRILGLRLEGHQWNAFNTII